MKHTVAGLLLAALTATQAMAGTLEAVLHKEPPSCVLVPEYVLCLSECAFVASKAPVLIVEGKLGFHMPYVPDTGEVHHNTTLAMGILALKYPAIPSPSEMEGTSGRVFLIDGELVNWRTLKRSHTVWHLAEDLIDCSKGGRS